MIALGILRIVRSDWALSAHAELHLPLLPACWTRLALRLDIRRRACLEGPPDSLASVHEQLVIFAPVMI